MDKPKRITFEGHVDNTSYIENYPVGLSISIVQTIDRERIEEWTSKDVRVTLERFDS